jgi:hypothetical protein
MKPAVLGDDSRNASAGGIGPSLVAFVMMVYQV